MAHVPVTMESSYYHSIKPDAPVSIGHVIAWYRPEMPLTHKPLVILTTLFAAFVYANDDLKASYDLWNEVSFICTQ